MSVTDIITKILFFFVRAYRVIKSLSANSKQVDAVQLKKTKDYSFNSSQEVFEIHEEDADADQNYIKKDNPINKNPEAKEQADIVVEKLKNASGIRPESFQQRNLDLEVGGLEEESKTEISGEDLWDNRSEEVDEMSIEGARKSINTTAKRSMIWRIKKNKMDKKEKISEEMEIAGGEARKHSNKVHQKRSNDNGGRSI